MDRLRVIHQEVGVAVVQNILAIKYIVFEQLLDSQRDVLQDLRDDPPVDLCLIPVAYVDAGHQEGAGLKGKVLVMKCPVEVGDSLAKLIPPQNGSLLLDFAAHIVFVGFLLQRDAALQDQALQD